MKFAQAEMKARIVITALLRLRSLFIFSKTIFIVPTEMRSTILNAYSRPFHCASPKSYDFQILHRHLIQS